MFACLHEILEGGHGHQDKEIDEAIHCPVLGPDPWQTGHKASIRSPPNSCPCLSDIPLTIYTEVIGTCKIVAVFQQKLESYSGNQQQCAHIVIDVYLSDNQKRLKDFQEIHENRVSLIKAF
ncbi:hypothetical protein FDK21_05720 [Cohaesibacter sp. CAU 1516]|uniref:hypothetical protein n=1 Tax=Cohaesibacter sp. CAU 1516 TaxID=2576038 RepID=UPI0010FEC929|nr:hypothetical protein [Cohaesibacter sp. CAU 1516]TLP49123.1 hypothetical protein FDK21_05720 [Cohaesibacter sp. CAU 1516]